VSEESERLLAAVKTAIRRLKSNGSGADVSVEDEARVAAIATLRAITGPMSRPYGYACDYVDDLSFLAGELEAPGLGLIT
jgi:hypothetical protein